MYVRASNGNFIVTRTSFAMRDLCSKHNMPLLGYNNFNISIIVQTVHKVYITCEQFLLLLINATCVNTISCSYKCISQMNSRNDGLHLPGSVVTFAIAEMFPQASVKLAITLYVVLAIRPSMTLARPLTTIGFCAVAGDNLRKMLEGSVSSQLVHISSTVMLVSLFTVASTVRRHSGGPAIQIFNFHLSS